MYTEQAAKFGGVGTEFQETVFRAADIIREGGMVMIPTETFYGLAVDPSNESAVQRLVDLKGRVGDSPIPLIAASGHVVRELTEIPEALVPATEQFWPGALTVAAFPRDEWPSAVTGGGNTVGIRVSAHPVAATIAAAAGGVMTATSANLRGASPATSPEALPASILDAVDFVVDAGPTAGGAPSTVVGWLEDEVVVFRRGAISVELLAVVLGRVPRLFMGDA